MIVIWIVLFRAPRPRDPLEAKNVAATGSDWRGSETRDWVTGTVGGAWESALPSQTFRLVSLTRTSRSQGGVLSQAPPTLPAAHPPPEARENHRPSQTFRLVSRTRSSRPQGGVLSQAPPTLPAAHAPPEAWESLVPSGTLPPRVPVPAGASTHCAKRGSRRNSREIANACLLP